MLVQSLQQISATSAQNANGPHLSNDRDEVRPHLQDVGVVDSLERELSQHHHHCVLQVKITSVKSPAKAVSSGHSLLSDESRAIG